MKSNQATARRSLRALLALAALLVGSMACADNVALAPVADTPPAEEIPRTALWPFNFPSRSRALYDSGGGPVTPHPAVARIIVPEDGATAFGSGTLVDVRDQYGLVVTNWHVVHEANGVPEVVFPGGFRSHARALKVDKDWDLAALVIWRPPIEPVKLSPNPPRPGDPLTIHGYGRGQYRIATGRCTTYYSPRANFPTEMVELDVEARQGDSGGPIFNQRGELAGVLFGAGQGTTLGSFGPRVGTFLASLAPDIGQAKDQEQIAVAERPAPNVNMKAVPSEGISTVGTIWPSSPWSPPAVVKDTSGPNQSANKSTAAAPAVQLAGIAAPPPMSENSALSWQDISGSQWYETAKSVFAVIGLTAVALYMVKLVR